MFPSLETRRIHHIRCGYERRLQVGDQQNQGETQHVEAEFLFRGGAGDDYPRSKVGNTSYRLIRQGQETLVECAIRRKAREKRQKPSARAARSLVDYLGLCDGGGAVGIVGNGYQLTPPSTWCCLLRYFSQFPHVGRIRSVGALEQPAMVGGMSMIS